MPHRVSVFLYAILLLVLVDAGGSAAGQSPVNMGHGGIAIRGYDAVAYFTDGKPVRGVSKYSYEWRHATWYFSNAAHRDMFAADPGKYMPAYGGYCAYGVAQGAKVDIDPTQWTIHDGRLFLNQSAIIHKAWARDIGYYIELGDRWWAEIKYK